MLEINKNPELLLVTRDGELDDDYYSAVYDAKRKAAMAQAGREAVTGAIQGAAAIGKGVVWMFTHELNKISTPAEQA